MSEDLNSITVALVKLQTEVQGLGDKISDSLKVTEKNITELWNKHNKLIESTLPAMADDLHSLDKRITQSETTNVATAVQIKEVHGFLARLDKSILENRKEDDERYGKFKEIIDQGKGMKIIIGAVVALFSFYVAVKEFTGKSESYPNQTTITKDIPK